MNDETKQSYSFIAKAAIPFITICAILSHLGYWSTFGIPYLEIADLSSLLLSFTYAAIVTIISYLMIGIHHIFPLDATIVDKAPRLANVILVSISVVTFIVYRVTKDGSYFMIFSFVLGIVCSKRFSENETLLQELIPADVIRRKVLFTILLIPILSFGAGKYRAHNLYMTKDVNDFMNIRTTDGVSEDYKYIGATSQYIFVLKMDHSSVMQIPVSEVKSITHDRKKK